VLTVVTGPPCSGKSTYVRQQAQPGDVVIDLDRIALALTVEDTADHDYPDHIRTVARRARIAAIDAALPLHAQGCRVWLIDAAPSKEQRAYYHRRDARFVSLTVTADVLAQRLAERPERNQLLVAQLTGVNAQVSASS
jgi:predicted kinase